MDMNLLESSCPEDMLLSGLIVPNPYWDEILRQIYRYWKPVVMSNDLGLMWIAAVRFEKEEATRIHILGPFFIYDISPV